MGTRVLVYEPDPTLRVRLVDALNEVGFRVEAPISEPELAVAVRLGCDLAYLDGRAQDRSGRPAIRALLETSPWAEVVAITGRGDVGHAVAALRDGASTVEERPLNLESVVEHAVQAVGRVAVRRQSGLHENSATAVGFDRLVGDSPAIHLVRATLQTAAQAPALPMLLAGEAGTGKLLAARLVHENGPRAGRELRRASFVGLSESEAEERLFGRGYPDRRGSYSADGMLAAAHQNIEHLPLSVQARLESFMDTGRYLPVGGEVAVGADVHVIATTRVDLLRLVDAGEFRRDLYYRLQVLPVGLPPLRSRGQDVRLLISYFISCFNLRFGLAVRGATRAVVDRLMSYGWSGNVRELRNAIQEAMVARKSGFLEVEDLPVGSSVAAAPLPRTVPQATVTVRSWSARLLADSWFHSAAEWLALVFSVGSVAFGTVTYTSIATVGLAMRIRHALLLPGWSQLTCGAGELWGATAWCSG